jgi:hypothetical protein
MIKTLSDLPEGAIGFETKGKLDAADYRDVLIPVIERAAAAGSLRVVLLAESFSGLTGGAIGLGEERSNRVGSRGSGVVAIAVVRARWQRPCYARPDPLRRFPLNCQTPS